MDAIRAVDQVTWVLCGLLLAAYIMRIIAGLARNWRAGSPGTVLGAYATAALIGLGVAIVGAVAGMLLIQVAAEAIGVDPHLVYLAQVGGAVTGSLLMSRAYGKWLAKPVWRWFVGEREERRGR